MGFSSVFKSIPEANIHWASMGNLPQSKIYLLVGIYTGSWSFHPKLEKTATKSGGLGMFWGTVTAKASFSRETPYLQEPEHLGTQPSSLVFPESKA